MPLSLKFIICLGCMLNFSAYSQSRPNILFLAIDDLRPELGTYGVKRAVTPSIDEFAKSSLKFDRAYVAYPLCLPSRAMLLTGMRFDFKGKDKKLKFNGMLSEGKTFPKLFKEQGYWTASTGKIYHGEIPKEHKDAWDVPGPFWKNRIRDWSEDIMSRVVAEGGDSQALKRFKEKGRGGNGALIWQSIDGDDDILNDGKTASEAIQFIKNRPKDRPFLICAGFSRPHMPWLAPKKYFDLYRDTTIKLPYQPEGSPRQVLPEDQGSGVGENNAQWNEGMSDEETKLLIKGYLASTSYSDAQVGRILKALEEEKLDSNTIVVVWGDHGYHLGDHGLWRKNTIYHIANHIPLLIRWPGHAQGRTTPATVESIDLYPTLLEMCGIKKDGLNLDGRSLKPLFLNPELKWPFPAFISAGSYYGMVNDHFIYAKSVQEHPTKLFDLQKDPYQWNNLANQPELKLLMQTLDLQINQIWGY